MGDTTEPFSLQMLHGGSQSIVKSVEDEIGHVVYVKQESLDCTEMSSKERDGNPGATVVEEERLSWNEKRDRDSSLAGVEVCCGSERRGNIGACYGSDSGDEACYGSDSRDDISITKNEPSWKEKRDRGLSLAGVEVCCGSERRGNIGACYGSDSRDDVSITKNEPSWNEGEDGSSDAKVEPKGGDGGLVDVPVPEEGLKDSDVLKQEPVDPEFVNVGIVKVEPQDNEVAAVMGVDPLAGDGHCHVMCHGEQTLDNYQHRALHIVSQPAGNAKTNLQPVTQMCQLCKKTFPTNDLINHKCSNVGLFKCPTCDKTFSDTETWNAHVNYDCGHQGPHKCLTCNKTFLQQQFLTSHVKQCGHQDPFECTLCDRTFLHKQGLTRHLLKHLSGRLEENKCKTCNKTFQQKHFNSHIQHCGRQKPYECPLCKKTFVKRQGLTRHARHYCGLQESYDCSTCKKTFNKRDDLMAHIRLGCGPEGHLSVQHARKLLLRKRV